MYMKQLHDIQTALNKVKDDVTSNALPQDDVTLLQTALDALKTECCGAMNTMYAYRCDCSICKNKCTMELNHVLQDPTFCLDAMGSGMGAWTQTGTRKIIT